MCFGASQARAVQFALYLHVWKKTSRRGGADLTFRGSWCSVARPRISLQLASAPVPLTRQQRDCQNGIEFMINDQLQERCQRFLLLSLLIS